MSRKKTLHQTKNADLRKMAEKAKIPNWENLERPEMIAALKALQPKKQEVKKEKPAKVEKKVKETSETKTPNKGVEEEEDKIVTLGVEEQRVPKGSKAARMKAKLAKQPKLPVIIPLTPGEKRGSTFSVILNGYRLNIKKGIYVNVPEQIAHIVMDSQQQSSVALEHKRRITGDKKDLIDAL